MTAPRPLSMADIRMAVAEHFGVSFEALASRDRSLRLAIPRQIGMYLCRRLTPRSYPEIGSMFGGRDHTTVIHACRRVPALVTSNPDLAREVELLHSKLAKLAEAA